MHRAPAAAGRWRACRARACAPALAAAASPRPRPLSAERCTADDVARCVLLRTSPAARAASRSLLLVGAVPLREALEAAPRLRLRALLLPADHPAAAAGGGGGGRAAAPAWLGDRLRALRLPASAAAAVGVAPVRLASPPQLRRAAGLACADGVEVVAEVEAPPMRSLPLLSASSAERSGAAAAVTSPGDDPGYGAAVAALLSARRVLLLDGVQDPGNVGSLLRSALAFGFGAAVLMPGCADPFGGRTLAASRGAALRLPLWRAAAAAADEEEDGGGGGGGGGCAGAWLRAAAAARAAGATLLAATPAADPAASAAALAAAAARALPGGGGGGGGGGGVWLALGAEGPGLSAAALAAAGPAGRVCIPTAGGVESLNVAAAGAVLMYALAGG